MQNNDSYNMHYYFTCTSHAQQLLSKYIYCSDIIQWNTSFIDFGVNVFRERIAPIMSWQVSTMHKGISSANAIERIVLIF